MKSYGSASGMLTYATPPYASVCSRMQASRLAKLAHARLRSMHPPPPREEGGKGEVGEEEERLEEEEPWHPPLVLPELPAECAGVLLSVYLQFTCCASTKKVQMLTP